MRNMPMPLPTAATADLQAAWPSRQPRKEPVAEAGLEVLWARTDDDVRQAQRLRHLVFAGEMGASLPTHPGAPCGLDIDRFDPYCEHLLVRERSMHRDAGTVIGTYRVLTPANAIRAGGLYSEAEFDLSPLQSMRGTMVELGRSCVHPHYRSGGVILALWAALAEFMHRNSLDTMVGCASISMRDGGHFAASLWEQLRHTHLAPPAWQVRPHLPLPIADLQRDLPAEAPALIKGYLRCGAKVLGPPAWDPDFNTADLPLLIRLSDLPARYLRHFF